jgi:DNA-binding transcriptional LysR family regulator
MRPPLRAGEAVAFRELTSEAMMLAVPLSHRLADQGAVTLGELSNEAFIAYPRRRGLGLSDAVMAECRRAGFSPRVAQETPQLSSTVNLVAVAMGIAIVPECMRHLRPESVRFLGLIDCDLKAVLGLGYRRDDRSRTVKNFLAMAAAE